MVVPATLPGQFFVTMDGLNVPLQVSAVNGNVTDLAGDISAWAGQLAALSIGMSVPASSGPENYHQGLVDNVAFSAVPVPEPTTAALILLGLLPLFRHPDQSK